MKKINYLLIAAIASLTVASCQKEQAEQFTPAGQGAGQEFTVSLPEVTKTALVEGKTVWAKNDSAFPRSPGVRSPLPSRRKVP